jgi:RNA polymerase-binding transcription factor DksA
MNLNHYKKRLEEEKTKLKSYLSKISEPVPERPEIKEAKVENINPLISDQSEVADLYEEFGNRLSVKTVLENRLSDVEKALERIKKGEYGLCANRKGEKHQIEESRLKADPAAKTCLKHLKQE